MKPVHDRIYLSAPHMSGREQVFIQQAFESNWIAPLGPNVDGFEQELAEYVKVSAASAVSSGTAAIHLALCLLGVSSGDSVFCSSLTFVASANPILYMGAEPVFIDSEPDTWNMSPEALEIALREAAASNRLPKAVIVVNLYGQSAKMDEIVQLCDAYKVPIIEDAAESLGSTYKGKASGTLGTFGVYSFNGNKIITTSGGGMLISNDEEAICKSRFLATQARDPAVHYQHSVLGYNYRMSNVTAGIGRAQLAVLDERVAARRAIFDRYVQALGDLPGVTFMPELEDTYSNRWLSTLTIDEKQAGVSIAQIIDTLAAVNIEARPVWKPLHLQPLFNGAKFYEHPELGAVSERLFQEGLCLPSGSGMSETDQNRVIDTVQEVFNSFAKLTI